MQDNLSIAHGPFRADILTRGATLSALWCEGASHSLVTGFANPEDYQRFPIYAGAIVGPMANRLGGGQATLSGQVWQMPRNEHGAHTLHSGPRGLHALDWEVVAQTPSSVRLAVTLEHTACGLPGRRRITAHYTLTSAGLDLTLTAESDQPTLINLAHHPYWAVTPDSRLQVNAARYLPVTAENLPTGERADVAGASFDLRALAAIPRHLDHNYVISDAPAPEARSIARLETPHYRLDVRSTAPGLQVYAGAGLPDIPAGLSRDQPFASGHVVALEPQFWPDAPNHPDFPSVVLEPGQIWEQFTQYCINC